MTTTFNYHGQQYKVDIDPIEWYNNNTNSIIKLPNGELLTIENWVQVDTPSPKPQVMSADVEFLVLEAIEVSEEELAFQSLLQFHKLTDNPKARKLWVKCCALAGYHEDTWNQEVYEAVNEYWEKLIDLIVD